MPFEKRTIKNDDNNIRLDRWFKNYFPFISHGELEKMLRKKLIKLDGKKVNSKDHLLEGQILSYPIFNEDKKKPKEKTFYEGDLEQDLNFLESITIYQDNDIWVLNKPHGLAVQGGSKTTYHIDGMMQAFEKKGFRPSLVHRLDRDTSGCLVLAKKRSVAAALGKSLQNREFKKTYFSLVKNVPKQNEGTIICYLHKSAVDGLQEYVTVVDKIVENSQKAITDFEVIDKIGDKYAWLSMQPITGRTHQLRVQTQFMGCPIIADPKYGEPFKEDKGMFENKLYLHARAIEFNHPKTQKLVKFVAPLPPHMEKTWKSLGFLDKLKEEGL